MYRAWPFGAIVSMKIVLKKLVLSMVSVHQLDERGHIPRGKKRALVLTNETRLLAFI